MMKLCKEREVTEGKTGWNRVDESRMKAESVTSCCRTCGFYCFEPKRDLINMYDFILHMCVFALVKSAMFTLLLTKTSHYQMWRVVRIGRRGAGRASTYYRPWDQSHQCALKKKKISSTPLQRGAVRSNDVDSSLIHVYISSSVGVPRERGLRVWMFHFEKECA